MKIQTLIVLCILSVVLSGCGASDLTDKFIPFTLRAKESYQPPVDPEPDVAQLVRSNPASVFVGNVTDLRVAKPRLNGAHWEGCASAATPDVGGRLSETVVAFTIESGHIGARYRVSPGHWCFAEPRRPV
ncbi:hypothetical protein [Bradyrhizobium sp. SYSU BS000235]|uniref:hypothetical protein n=1 Tax=Bradyrhizobium sp. SYSU BS000235 TaxID=3411332 RepID=UPI003C78ADD7